MRPRTKFVRIRRFIMGYHSLTGGLKLPGVRCPLLTLGIPLLRGTNYRVFFYYLNLDFGWWIGSDTRLESCLYIVRQHTDLV